MFQENCCKARDYSCLVIICGKYFCWICHSYKTSYTQTERTTSNIAKMGSVVSKGRIPMINEAYIVHEMWYFWVIYPLPVILKFKPNIHQRPCFDRISNRIYHFSWHKCHSHCAVTNELIFTFHSKYLA